VSEPPGIDGLLDEADRTREELQAIEETDLRYPAALDAATDAFTAHRDALIAQADREDALEPGE
jgi:hypothetical protein